MNQYKTCEISEHNYSYKQAYIELFIAEEFDKLVPILNDSNYKEYKYDESEFTEKKTLLRKKLKICSNYIYFLKFNSLRTKLEEFKDYLS